MRYVQIPKDIEVVIDGKRSKIDMRGVVINTLLMDRVFLKTRATMKQADKIDAAFAGAKAGSVVELEDSDWDPLNKAADTPSQELLPIARKCITFLDAICEAPQTKPEEACSSTSKGGSKARRNGSARAARI